MAFRQAHHVVGTVVARAEKLGRSLDQLTLEELRSVEPALGPDAREVFNLEKALARRALIGAPGSKEVRRQLTRWRKR
jgi:argininosuccinate lyase